MRYRPGRGDHRRMDTTDTKTQFPTNVVTAMDAPAILVAGGWLVAMLGINGGSLGPVVIGSMALVCGTIMAVPMTVIALYRAINVDARPVIWGAALLDAAVAVSHGALLYAVSR